MTKAEGDSDTPAPSDVSADRIDQVIEGDRMYGADEADEADVAYDASRLLPGDDTPVSSDVSADRIGDVDQAVKSDCSLCGADEAEANGADDDANEEKDLNHR